jgi:hypothetical protein
MMPRCLSSRFRSSPLPALAVCTVGPVVVLVVGRRISDVMVGNGIDDDCISISSPSSQRSIIS